MTSLGLKTTREVRQAIGDGLIPEYVGTEPLVVDEGEVYVSSALLVVASGTAVVHWSGSPGRSVVASGSVVVHKTGIGGLVTAKGSATIYAPGTTRRSVPWPQEGEIFVTEAVTVVAGGGHWVKAYGSGPVTVSGLEARARVSGTVHAHASGKTKVLAFEDAHVWLSGKATAKVLPSVTVHGGVRRHERDEDDEFATRQLEGILRGQQVYSWQAGPDPDALHVGSGPSFCPRYSDPGFCR